MNFMGSKNRIASEILEVILKDRVEGQVYVEPFVGGCNSIDKVDGSRIGSDINPYLIAMWRGLQFGLEKPMEIPREQYVMYRNKFNSLKVEDIRFLSSVVNYPVDIFGCDKRFVRQRTKDLITFRELFLIGWVGFMASFNGRFYDGGYSGKTETRDYVDEQIRNTLAQLPLIKDVVFYAGSYDEIFPIQNSIIYCDIPYQNTKQYSYSNKFDYDKFWDWVREKSEHHQVFVSEYTAPTDFEVVWEKKVTNSMHPTKTKRTTEKLYKLKK